jgi:hypothetical protein
MKNSKFEELQTKVIELSNSDIFNEAKFEWDIVGNDIADEDTNETCVCGHKHLKYLFEIRNRYTNQSLYPIGSECIKKFESANLDNQMKLAKYGEIVFKNKGKKHDGRTYDEICKSDENYILFLKENAMKSKYLKLVSYYNFYINKIISKSILS